MTTGKRTELFIMNLREFLEIYCEEIQEYYSIGEWTLADESITQIYCLIDQSTGSTHRNGVSAKYRRAGKIRRNKMKHRYSYKNPLNRILGFLILSEKEKLSCVFDKKILLLDLICSSSFTIIRGIGGDLMDFMKDYAKKHDYTDIILEVANNITRDGIPDSDSEEEEEQEEEEEEQAEDYSEEEEEQAEQQEEEEEDYSEELLDILSHEFWRKTMRRHKGGCPSYTISETYIHDCLESLFYEYESDEDEIIQEKTSNEETGYHGYWYRVGKQSQLPLFRFYEKFGFTENSDIWHHWNCFSSIPFPTMICPVK